MRVSCVELACARCERLSIEVPGRRRGAERLSRARGLLTLCCVEGGQCGEGGKSGQSGAVVANQEAPTSGLGLSVRDHPFPSCTHREAAISCAMSRLISTINARTSETGPVGATSFAGTGTTLLLES